MRIIALHLDQIHFEKRTYDDNLFESIQRRGLAFPIKVTETVDGYQCIDGHKRLSVLLEISKAEPTHRYITKIPVIIANSEMTRSNDCWRGRNTH